MASAGTIPSAAFTGTGDVMFAAAAGDYVVIGGGTREDWGLIAGDDTVTAVPMSGTFSHAVAVGSKVYAVGQTQLGWYDTATGDSGTETLVPIVAFNRIPVVVGTDIWLIPTRTFDGLGPGPYSIANVRPIIVFDTTTDTSRWFRPPEWLITDTPAQRPQFSMTSAVAVGSTIYAFGSGSLVGLPTGTAELGAVKIDTNTDTVTWVGPGVVMGGNVTGEDVTLGNPQGIVTLADGRIWGTRRISSGVNRFGTFRPSDETWFESDNFAGFLTVATAERVGPKIYMPNLASATAGENRVAVQRFPSLALKYLELDDGDGYGWRASALHANGNIYCVSRTCEILKIVPDRDGRGPGLGMYVGG